MTDDELFPIDPAVMKDAQEFLEKQLASLSGRGRGAESPLALHRMLAMASLPLAKPPARSGARPAAETGGSVKLSQVVARLREEREARGLTLRDVHDATGITCGRLSRLEHEIDTNPTIGTLERIAEALEVELRVTLAERSQ